MDTVFSKNLIYKSRKLTVQPRLGKIYDEVPIGLAINIFRNIACSLFITQEKNIFNFVLIFPSEYVIKLSSMPVKLNGSGNFSIAVEYNLNKYIRVHSQGLLIAELIYPPVYSVNYCSIELDENNENPDFYPISEPIPTQISSARVKAARARSHIKEIESTLDDYRNSKPYRVYRKPDSFSHYTRYIDVLHPPPEILPAMIGDAIHNARSALDHVAVQMAEKNHGNGKGVYFPIAINEESLPELIKKNKFTRAGDRAVELLKTFNPYAGGSPKVGDTSILRGLHNLDIIDKHKLIILIFGQAVQATMRINPKKGIYLMRDIDSAFVKLETGEILDTGIPIHLDIEDDLPPFFQVVFDDSGDFAGHEVVSTLKIIVAHVEKIIDAFEAL
ncbi:hypothetical protein F1654_12790 [Alkalicaulis satelles]|uniref:Uncharacterized protein n=1 Tax=Alkalicaulis satelles TaxID=2609175 RepID=A0A5M6ZCX9_9PROT|nr:hypothetical protein [Alkalicaulis satelles]KAA5800938.1 hypothetical protein F1654_12790 [Alkalicaulis satelles]